MIRALLAAVAFAATTVATARAQTAAPTARPSAPAADNLSCTPDGADLEHPVPGSFPDTVIPGLAQSYRAPEIVGLRTALSAFVAGKADPESSRTLKDVSPGLLEKKFILLADGAGVFGGYWLVIQFRDHPEAIYNVWVYGHGKTSRNGPFIVRSWVRVACSPQQQRWLELRYGELSRRLPGG